MLIYLQEVEVMKIKLGNLLEKDYSLIRDLLNHNIEIDENADYEIILSNTEDGKETLIAKTNENDFKIIDFKKVMYFESFDNDVFAVMKNERYKLKEKLYYYEARYCAKEFVRVSKSYIVNIKEIETIRTTFNRKFILVMSNKVEIDVNRSYYEVFKERIGL